MTRETKLETAMAVCIGVFLVAVFMPWSAFTPVVLAASFAGTLVAFGKRLER